MRTSVRFGNDFVHNAQLAQIFRRNLHRRGRGFRFRRVAPNDGCATLRRNDGIEAILEDVHFVADGNGQGSARAPFPRHRNEDGHGQPRHFPQVPCDGFALTAFFRIDAGIGALRIHKAENRPAELGRELHYAQRFPVSFRFGLAEVARQALLGVASLLMADDRHGPAVILRKARNDGFVVGEAAVAVQFHEIRKKIIDVVQRVRPLLVPRDLFALPGPQMGIKLETQLRHLLADALQLCLFVPIAGQAPQFLDIFLEMFDHFLAFGLLLVQLVLFFFFRSHAPTTTACPPQTRRIASTNSGEGFTRCPARITHTDPSGRRNSNTTGQIPGASSISWFSWSIASSLSFRKSSRKRNSLAAGRSAMSWSRRASSSDRRIPASSICTRTFMSSGLPGFSTCSSRAKLSGNASNSWMPVMS